MRLPRIALTVGDPAGIGPEIVAKAAADPGVRAVCEPVVFAPPAIDGMRVGQVSAAAGQAANDTLLEAVNAAKRGDVDAIATAPINKLAFAEAGLPWKGHTDLLAHCCGVERVAMMFHSPPLKVVLATVHVPLAVGRGADHGAITSTRILALTATWLPRFDVAAPRIAVAGLNPHAGESGRARRRGRRGASRRPSWRGPRAAASTSTGRFPADTIFVRALARRVRRRRRVYHDQGLIPVKLLAFDQAVNVTLGLPIIRTSVDHGTAFDIAGKGVADPGSMIAAVKLAAALARKD